jgi:hypothetical protein
MSLLDDGHNDRLTHRLERDAQRWQLALDERPSDVRIEAAPAARRHRRWVAPLIAAAAVVVVAAGALAAAQLAGRHSSHRPAAPSPSVSLPAPVPAGQQRITYHGLAVDVPSSWRLNDARCGTPIHDTVMLPGLVASCAINRPPKIVSVQFAGPNALWTDGLTSKTTRTVAIDGISTTIVEGQDTALHQAVVTVPSRSAVALLSAPQESQVIQLIASLSIVDVDANGCLSKASEVLDLSTARPSARAGIGRALIPGAPAQVSICRYEAGWIEQSATLTGARRDAFVQALNAAPPGYSIAAKNSYLPSTCRTTATSPGSLTGRDAMDSEAFLVTAHYPSGPDLVVIARLGFCGRLGESNGTRQAQVTRLVQDQIGGTAGSSGRIPDVVKGG